MDRRQFIAGRGVEHYIDAPAWRFIQLPQMGAYTPRALLTFNEMPEKQDNIERSTTFACAAFVRLVAVYRGGW